MEEEPLTFPADYLAALEAGPVNDAFIEALGKLTPDQREFLAYLMEDRLARRNPTPV